MTANVKEKIYVREHFNKEVRKQLSKERITIHSDNGSVNTVITSLKKKEQRMWTLNRSPHGNKTAREQFGRQVWQRKIYTLESAHDSGMLKKRNEKRNEIQQYVERKEVEKTLV